MEKLTFPTMTDAVTNRDFYRLGFLHCSAITGDAETGFSFFV